MTNVQPITKFEGEYRFLSNFDTEPFEFRNYLVPSGEHAFVLGKLGYLLDPTQRRRFEDELFQSPIPQYARNLGKKVKINSAEWDKHSMWWMRELTHAKFGYIPGYAGKLVNTGAAMLIEGNTWGDKIWGRCLVNGKWMGKNLLGAILMEERGYWLHSDFKDKR
jgi:ribA/ribD-fused uncharacterized protein